MAESHFVSALKQRRAEHLGQLEAVRVDIARLEALETETISLLGHVDALLRVEAPDFRIETVRPRKPRAPQSHKRDDGKRLPVTQAVLRLLRTEGVPLTVDEVVGHLRSDYADIGEKKLLQNVRMFMSSKKTAGVLHANENEGRPLRYGISA